MIATAARILASGRSHQGHTVAHFERRTGPAWMREGPGSNTPGDSAADRPDQRAAAGRRRDLSKRNPTLQPPIGPRL